MTFEAKLMRATAARLGGTAVSILIFCCIGGLLSVNANAQLPASSTQNLSARLQLVFYGYPQIGVPKSGTAILDDTGLSEIHDLAFTRTGGELSPDGRFVAYDNCSSPDRGIYIVEPDGSKATRVLALSDNTCAEIRWSPDSTKLSYASHRDH